MIADAVDGAVGPLGGGGGMRGGVLVGGGGIVGEKLEAPAVSPVHLDFAEVEVGAVTFPTPADPDGATTQHEGERGLDGIQVRRGGVRSLDAEDLADGRGVVFMVFRGADEGGETGDDTGRHGGRKSGGFGGKYRLVAQVSCQSDGFPFVPLPGGVRHGAAEREQCLEVGGIRSLLGDVGGGEFQGGHIGADVVAELDEIVGFSCFGGG